jgi:hypothetical protein
MPTHQKRARAFTHPMPTGAVVTHTHAGGRQQETSGEQFHTLSHRLNFAPVMCIRLAHFGLPHLYTIHVCSARLRYVTSPFPNSAYICFSLGAETLSDT